MKKYSQYIIVLFAILLTCISISSSRVELQNNIVANHDIHSDSYFTNTNNFLLFNFEEHKNRHSANEENFRPYLDNFWSIPTSLLQSTYSKTYTFSSEIISKFTTKKGLSITQIIFPFQYFW